MSERPNRAAVGSAILLLLALGGAAAQEGDSKPAPAIEPGVIEALDKMGAYLRTINNFAVQAEATIDEVLESGQKLQFDSTINIRAERPEHLWMEVVSDRKHRQFFYDGKTFTDLGPAQQVLRQRSRQRHPRPAGRSARNQVRHPPALERPVSLGRG